MAGVKLWYLSDFVGVCVHGPELEIFFRMSVLQPLE